MLRRHLVLPRRSQRSTNGARCFFQCRGSRTSNGQDELLMTCVGAAPGVGVAVGRPPCSPDEPGPFPVAPPQKPFPSRARPLAAPLPPPPGVPAAPGEATWTDALTNC